MDILAQHGDVTAAPRSGFSLVELVIAMLILTGGVLGLAGATGYLIRQTTLAEVMTERTAALQSVVEQLKATPWDSLGSGSQTIGNFELSWRQASGGSSQTVVYQIVSVGPGLQKGTGKLPILGNSVADTFEYRLLRN